MSWLKVEAHTPDKPEIRQIARACRVSAGDAFAAWFRLWAWLDSVTADGHLDFLIPADCDEIARLPGIGKALREVGWIEFDAGGGAIVMNWGLHNGKSAKKRAVDAARQNDYRARTGKDTGYRPLAKRRVTQDA